MFKRDILFHLERWKVDTHRKPLILRGARQVGKTTVVNEFGKQFDNYLYLNLEKREAASLFELNVSLKDLMPLFFVHCGKVRNEGTILLFVECIFFQTFPQSVSALKQGQALIHSSGSISPFPFRSGLRSRCPHIRQFG